MAWDTIDDEIISYLSGELTEAEKEAFEKRLETDTALSDAMDRHRAFEETLRGYGKYQRKSAEIAEMNKRFSEKERKKRRIKQLYNFGLIAAAALAILMVYKFILPGQKSYCPEELYAEVYAPRNADQVAGQAPSAEQTLILANTRFNEKQPSEAANFYRQALGAGTLTPARQNEARFNLGQSLMLLEDFEPAIERFGKITSGPYIQLCQWYTALSYLRLGQIEKAHAILVQISKEQAHDRQAEAGALLKKMERLKVCQ